MAARDSTVAVVACGPVGLCAIVAAANLRTQLLFAIDSVRDRLGRAEKLQANPLNPLDVMANLQAQVEAVTEGRSADLDIEAVGRSPALKTAFEIVRSFGIFSSIGVHSQDIPWSAKEAYEYVLAASTSPLTVEVVDTDLIPARTSGFKWADAPSGASSARL
ncbi:unnamed protein product [Colletotrichum noveboracense]|uniref:Alcohol dehydrogenase-like C-terminal domain-containing protein n=1 Tax=Colletotrichum noveboracense TaxID=2664923 RepID=A0A9W4WDY4_9PEZI|nr:hypothetical protein COL940_014378 [Colletotrichum noveboracense]CAI0652438.1 unnamed protein product [Colletotrichum noveboracense]